MFNFKLLATLGCLCALATPTQAQDKDYPVKGGLTVRARAYTDYGQPLRYASRFYLQIAKTPADGTKWDFTLDEDPKSHIVGSVDGISPTSYNNRPTATLHLTLHQYQTYDEQVNFKNLDLGPLRPTEPGIYPGFGGGTTPRYLQLAQAQTIVTPSGISVTLPQQGAQTLRALLNVNGNLNALFFKIDVAPDQREVVLPNSPLHQKYPRSVTIKLETPNPSRMVWYMADNSFKTLAISFSDLKTLQHLDTLSLILRQRVELRAIPVSIEVPVEREAKAQSR